MKFLSMRNYLIIFLCFLTSEIYSQFVEEFDATGTLISNGWYNHNGANGEITISSNSLLYPGISNVGNKVSLFSGASEDVNKSIGTPITNALYYSLVVNVRDLNGLKISGEYPVHFASSYAIPPAALPTPYMACLYIRPGAAVNTFNLGVKNSNEYAAVTGAATFDLFDLPVNTPVFVVVKYVFGTQTASLYVNPPLNSIEPSANVTDNSLIIAFPPGDVRAVAIRQIGTIDSGTGNIDLDTFRVSDNWDDVTDGVLSISNFNNKATYNVFPNPVKEHLTININDAVEDAVVVELYDSLGHKVLDQKFNSSDFQINTSGLVKGVYFLKILTDFKSECKKLIVE